MVIIKIHNSRSHNIIIINIVTPITVLLYGPLLCRFNVNEWNEGPTDGHSRFLTCLLLKMFWVFLKKLYLQWLYNWTRELKSARGHMMIPHSLRGSTGLTSIRSFFRPQYVISWSVGVSDWLPPANFIEIRSVFVRSERKAHVGTGHRDRHQAN